jgi:choline dehydrogenase-like flavoprotein
MRERPWVGDRGWPISPDVLPPYYRKAGSLLELGDVDGTVPPRFAGHVSVAQDGPLEPFVWRSRLGGPLRFRERMWGEMEASANVHVVMHANVTGITTNDTATQVESLELATLDGRTGRARARVFVLACGGLETPRLLLNANQVQPAGLGNSRDLVGRYFMEHPNGVIGTLFLANDEAEESLSLLGTYVEDAGGVGSWKPALCLGETVERRQQVGGGYYRFRGRQADWLREWRGWREQPAVGDRLDTVAQLFDERLYGALREALGYSMGKMEFADRQAPVFVEFEQTPNAESRVLLTGERDRLGMRKLVLDWRLSEQDFRTARALGEAIGREAPLSGRGRFRFAEWILEDGIERSPEFGIANHHSGTIRMADDPQFGVVDSDCRLFDCPNLYVAGSAVFPTVSFVNPTLTIVALAYRLADALKARLT